MALNTPALKMIVLHEVEHNCPLSVFDVEYQKRKNETTVDLDRQRTPKEVMSIFELVYDESTRRLKYADVHDYRRQRISDLYGFLKQRTTLDPNYVMRLSKKKDKATKNVVRLFSVAFGLFDHNVEVTTDPTDATIVSIKYPPK